MDNNMWQEDRTISRKPQLISRLFFWFALVACVFMYLPFIESSLNSFVRGIDFADFATTLAVPAIIATIGFWIAWIKFYGFPIKQGGITTVLGVLALVGVGFYIFAILLFAIGYCLSQC